MKNRDKLNLGSKPAPGELAIIQGLVNTLNIENGIDDIATAEQLKAWMVQFGLLQNNETVSKKDLKTVLEFREALRQLLLANNGGKANPEDLELLNRLASRYPLQVSFAADGSFSLSTIDQGIGRVMEQILAEMIKAVVEGTWSNLKACQDNNCYWAFYDSSKNHSGRWCSMTVCGSRDKARAYRKRQAKSRI